MQWCLVDKKGGTMSKSSGSGYEMDMCEGPLIPKMLKYTIPLILSNVLILCYNAVDTIVIGRFVGSGAMAAVGTTSCPIGLMANLFMGMTVGANVLIARYCGAKNDGEIQETLHTSVTFGIICGVMLAVLGMFVSKPVLRLMGTPDNVIDMATLYMQIYFLGMPAFFFGGYGGASIRAVGDTKRPLIYSAISGMVNVVLNLIFVIGLHWDVAGVAWATVIAQYITALMLFFRLRHIGGSCHLSLSKLHISRDKLKQIICIGIPVGIQSCLFSISNVIIQSAINSFGSFAMAGSGAAVNLENFANVVMTSFSSAALSFTSQNLGGRRYDRIPQILTNSLILSITGGLIFGMTIFGFGEKFLTMYTTDAEVIAFGIRRMKWVCAPCFISAIMNIFSSMLRGLGYGTLPMVVLFGTCGLRILWLYTVFAWYPTWEVLFMGYPISWAITGVVLMISYAVIWKKIKRNYIK